VTRPGLARIWSIVGTLLALFAAGTWINLQGGKSFAEIPGLDGRAPVTSAYEAVLIVGCLLGILSGVGIFYFRMPTAADGALFPVVAIADVGPHDMRAWTMRLYQAFFFSIFLLLPAVSLYVLNDAVLERGVLWHQGDAAFGGIALKNAFSLTRGSSKQDADEFACRSEVTRKEGFTWLANMRCDLAKSSRLKPFEKSGKSIADDTASVALSCTRTLADGRAEGCENARDISEQCEASERRCRGMQWLPGLSPALMLIATVFGWTMFAWLVVEAICRKIRLVSRQRAANLQNNY
jgi:hypothetical protein